MSISLSSSLVGLRSSISKASWFWLCVWLVGECVGSSGVGSMSGDSVMKPLAPLDVEASWLLFWL